MPPYALPVVPIGLPRLARPGTAARWERRTNPLVDERLQRSTWAWVKSLPDAMKPVRCARYYPRVLNQVAALWHLEEACLDYLDGLLADRRGNRRGFGYGVVTELRRLRAHRIALRPDRPVDDGAAFPDTQPLGLD